MAEPEVQKQDTPQVLESDKGALLAKIIEMTETPKEDELSFTKALTTIVHDIAKKGRRKEEKIDKVRVDQVIGEIDRQLSAQVDEILHHKALQQLEAAWRGLKFVVDRTDFRENIQIHVLNVSKKNLIEDFKDAPEIPQSGLYKIVYSGDFGVFGGEPIGAMIANYEFDPSNQDITLLQNVASVAAMAHAPIIAAASPEFFGLKDFRNLSKLNDLESRFRMDRYTKWRSFRDSSDARYVGLTMPRFLLRLPYDPKDHPIDEFTYKEAVAGHHDRYLWGNTAFAFATRLTESFAKYRWCCDIIGPLGGGEVGNLPLPQYESMGRIETKIPTEVLIPERRDYELSTQGFIPLVMRKNSDNASFFAANSVQQPRTFGKSEQGKRDELNYKLGTQFPYMVIACRFAHLLKVYQREQLGRWKERTDLQMELNSWIQQYVLNQENPPAELRSTRPLREAQIVVQDVPGDAGWYKVDIKMRPHFKYMGADFTLSLVGRLDKEE